ncbi:hypothetical protein [Sulfurovum sp.]|uniref:hypothetical protein n=1 Tax=Sulfurovum sp. TaxID=1969726 RepID=UPI0035687BC0
MYVKVWIIVICLTTSLFGLIKEKSFIGSEKVVLELDKNEKIINIKEGGTIIETKNGKSTYTNTYYILTNAFLYRIEDKKFSILKKIALDSISNDITGFDVYSYFPSRHSEDIEHIYLADNQNKKIIKIDENNHISYLIGNGTFHNLVDIDVDRENHIRILDGNKVVVLNENGTVLFEHNGSKTASGLQLNAPTQIWGLRYIFDKGNQRISYIDASIIIEYGQRKFRESGGGSGCNKFLPKQAGMINKSSTYLTLSDIGNKQLIVISNLLCTSDYVTYIELQRAPLIGVKLYEKDMIFIVYGDDRNALYLATMDYDLLRKFKHKIEDLIPEYNPHAQYNNPKETNQKPAGGFLIAHFKR